MKKLILLGIISVFSTIILLTQTTIFAQTIENEIGRVKLSKKKAIAENILSYSIEFIF